MIMFQHLGRWGRFGNQLFQYATLFAITKKKKSIPDWSDIYVDGRHVI